MISRAVNVLLLCSGFDMEKEAANENQFFAFPDELIRIHTGPAWVPGEIQCGVGSYWRWDWMDWIFVNSRWEF